MKFFCKLTSILGLLALLGQAGGAFAATCTSLSSGNWNVAARWSCGRVPSVGGGPDTAVIAAAHTVTLDVDATVQQVTVNGTLNTDNNNRILTLTTTSPLFVRAAAGVFTPGNSTVRMSSNANETLTSNTAITFNNLELSPAMSGNRTYTFGSGAITINGNFDIIPTVPGTTARRLTVDMGAAITVAGITTINGTGIASSELDTSGTDYALTSGRIVIGANGILTANNSTITLNGAVGPLFTGTSATFNEDTSVVVMNSPASVTLNSGFTTFYRFTVNMPGQTGTLGSALDILNAFAVNAGTMNDGGFQINSGNPVTTMTMAAGTNLVLGTPGTDTVFPMGYTTGNITLDAASTVTYNSNAAQAISGAPVYGNLVLASTAAAIKTAAAAVTVNGTLTIDPNNTFAAGTFNHILRGGFTNNGVLTPSSGTVTFNGTSPQTIGGSTVTAFNNLTVSSSGGVVLSNSPTVGGVLALTSGIVTTGGNALLVSSNCTSMTRGTGFVAGNLRLTFPAGTTTCTYHVGSNTSYAPIGITITASGSGTLTGNTTGNEHTQIATSGIDPTKDVNRFWTLGAGGDTLGAVVTSYGVTFNFIAGDIDSGATATSFVVGKYAGSAWTLPGSVTANALATGVSGVAGPISTPTDFAVGETAFVCSLPAGSPSGTTCVCDNYGRAELNPSTIFGGNYTLTQNAAASGWPRIATPGFMQMTSNSGNMSTSATLPGTFPAAGNLISVEFKHYAYNGSGADGIALTLSDSATTPAPGAFGGSLGYAQKSNAACAPLTPPCNGFAGGWVGIALDEFGNYSNPTEGRSGGPGFRADSVAVRGSGAGLIGYPYMAGTASLAPGIDNTAAPRAPGYSYRIKVDARCYERDTNNADIVCSNPSLAKVTTVSVERDTSGGTTYSSVVAPFNAYTANAGQADVPLNWKLSFTGSTGGAVNFHEIAGLKVCAQTITPPAGYRIEVNNLTPNTCSTPGGSPSSPIVTVTALDTNGNTITTYDKTINLSATLSGGGASAATWRKVGAGANLPGNQYTFVPADNGVAQFYLTDASPQSVLITVTENGGTLASTFATPVVFSGATFTIANIDSLAGNVGGGAVAGRSHLMQVTRTNGCSPDATYAGAKILDGWYTPVSGAHPTGALPPQICAPNGSNTCLPTTGSCQTLSIAAPTIDASSNNMPVLTFAAGTANFCIVTSDVGKYSVSLRDDSSTPPSANAVVGSSEVLTVRPYAIAVSNVTQAATSTNNPGDNTSGGSLFAIAGSSFEATVAGYLWKSSGVSSTGVGDTDGDGLPDASALFSQLSFGGLAPHYADTVTFTAIAPFAPVPGSGPVSSPFFAGSMGGGPVTVTGGSGAGSLTYNEVGTFTMAAAPAAHYLATSGLSLANRVAIFSTTADTQNALVGRFRPAHFALAANPIIFNRSELACVPASGTNSPFTYMGEPIDARFTLTAMNSGGVQTQNYAGDYARLSLGTADFRLRAFNRYPVATAVRISQITQASPGVVTTVTAHGYATNNIVALIGVQGMTEVNNGAYTITVISPTSFSIGVSTLAFTAYTGAGSAINRSAAAPVDLTARLATSPATGSPGWQNGTAAVNLPFLFTRAVPADGPFIPEFGIAPVDPDGVQISPYTLAMVTGTPPLDRASIGLTTVRHGRMRIDNAYGSELLPLWVNLMAQTWDSVTATYISNTDDNCTPLTPSICSPLTARSFTLNNPVPAMGSTVSTCVNVGGTMALGVGRVGLAIPVLAPANRRGSIVMRTSSAFPALAPLETYIPGIGVQTFGLYKGGRVIYLRELHF